VGNHVLWLSVGVVSEITHATACCGTGVGSLGIKGIALRFNGALGFGGGRRLRARTHHLRGLIGGGA
jgi:hypothetical protein